MFIAKAYLNNNYIGLMSDITSHEAEDCIMFIWEALQKGYYCTLQFGNTIKYYSPYFFTDCTTDIYDCEVNVI